MFNKKEKEILKKARLNPLFGTINDCTSYIVKATLFTCLIFILLQAYSNFPWLLTLISSLIISIFIFIYLSISLFGNIGICSKSCVIYLKIKKKKLSSIIYRK